jgi:sortase A
MKVHVHGKRCSSVWLRVSQYFFLVAGIAILGYCAYVWLDARVYQRNEERSFEEIKLSAPPPVPGRLAPPIPHAVLGKIEIHQVGISAMIAEGVDHGTLKRAVGHIPGTALPGEDGNIVLAAHRDTFFRPLRNIQKGTEISLTTWNGAYRYRVESIQIVGPDDVGVLSPTSMPTLTLVTCYPFYFVGSAPKRFIVRAGLIAG